MAHAARLSVLTAFLWGSLVHMAVAILGGFLFLWAAALACDSEGRKRAEPPEAAALAARWFLQHLLAPFVELSLHHEAVLPAEDSEAAGGPSSKALHGAVAWSAWACYQAGLLLMLVAGLGLLVLTRASVWVLGPPELLGASQDRRARRGVLCAAVPYAALAAALLAWQAEAGAVLTSVSGLYLGNTLRGPQEARQKEVYKGAHDAFVRAYGRLECKGVNMTSSGHPRHLSCTAPSYEAKLMNSVVPHLCRVRSSSPKQVARLKRCFVLGEKLGLDTPGEPYSESYGFFCRCWAASLGFLPLAAAIAKAAWLGLFSGVLAVFYVASERRLRTLDPTARGEVVGFFVAAATFLAFKAIVARPLLADL